MGFTISRQQRILFDSGRCATLKVIICTKESRGNGSGDNPFRKITQVLTEDGCLIAEYDPFLCDDNNEVQITGTL